MIAQPKYISKTFHRVIQFRRRGEIDLLSVEFLILS